MKKKCRCCNGSGQEMDHAQTGAQLSTLRAAANIKQSTMAKSLGMSCAFLSQLESGKRRWTPALISKYHQFIGKFNFQSRNFRD